MSYSKWAVGTPVRLRGDSSFLGLVIQEKTTGVDVYHIDSDRVIQHSSDALVIAETQTAILVESVGGLWLYHDDREALEGLLTVMAPQGGSLRVIYEKLTALRHRFMDQVRLAFNEMLREEGSRVDPHGDPERFKRCPDDPYSDILTTSWSPGGVTFKQTGELPRAVGFTQSTQPHFASHGPSSPPLGAHHFEPPR